MCAVYPFYPFCDWWICAGSSKVQVWLSLFLLFPFSAPGCVATSTYSSTWLSGGLGRTLVLPFLSRSVSTTTTYQQQSMEWTVVGSRRRATTKKCCTQKRRAATTTPAMRWNLHQEKRYSKIFSKYFLLATTFLTKATEQNCWRWQFSSCVIWATAAKNLSSQSKMSNIFLSALNYAT